MYVGKTIEPNHKIYIKKIAQLRSKLERNNIYLRLYISLQLYCIISIKVCLKY